MYYVTIKVSRESKQDLVEHVTANIDRHHMGISSSVNTVDGFWRMVMFTDNFINAQTVVKNLMLVFNTYFKNSDSSYSITIRSN